jgi:hypothetical protein
VRAIAVLLISDLSGLPWAEPTARNTRRIRHVIKEGRIVHTQKAQR